jgi:hypothetical protein
MADIVNIPPCSDSQHLNTGRTDCFIEMQKPVMVILAPMSHRIKAANRADITTFKTFLQAEALAGHIFPLSELVLSADNSEDMSISTDAYGTKKVTKEGDYDWLFESSRGGNCFNAIMRSFNKMGYGAYVIDSDQTLFGTFVTAYGDMRPLTTSITYAPKFKIANGADSSKYFFRLALSRPEELNDAGKLAYIVGSGETTSIDYPTEVVGNLDVRLRQIANAADAFTVGANLSCGNADLYDLFADELAAVAAWAVTNASTGATITVTGVTKDATNKGWILAHATAGAAKITSTGAAAWAALTPTAVGGGGENGYECDTITATLIHT